MTTVAQAGRENGVEVDGQGEEVNAPFVPHTPARTLARSTVGGGYTVYEPAHQTIKIDGQQPVSAALVFKDGTAYKGYSFGAENASIAGECVFQTGADQSGRKKRRDLGTRITRS